MRKSTILSIDAARRIALDAQGVGQRSARRPDRASILRLVNELGVLQLDAVNVLCRAHYLPVFARLGAYDRSVLDDAAWSDSSSPRSLFEYWGHEASMLPVTSAPLFRWRMGRAARGEGIWGSLARFGRERKRFVESVLRAVAKDGPLRPGDLERPKAGSGGWWERRSDTKHALDWLFWAGKVTTSSRTHFARSYDLPERVLPADVLAAPTPKEADAHRELVRISARALGIATDDDLADYFRLKRSEARPRIAELVEEGELQRVEVEGWSAPAFLSPTAARRRPRTQSEVVALISPFDPVVWYRKRALRLFDFHYRIGIYTPAAERTHGYYVLPFLVGDRLAGRVDLKADRARGLLTVPSAHLEPDVSADAVAGPLADELQRMAAWLGLPAGVEVARKGKLAPALRRHV